MFLLSEVQQANSPSVSVSCAFADLKHAVVEAKQNRIEVSEFRNKSLVLIYTAHLLHTITAITPLTVANDNILAVLDDSNTLLLIYRDKKTVVHSLATLDVTGHQLTVDSRPILVLHGKAVVVHAVLGYLQVFRLHVSVAELARHSKKRSFEPDWTSHSVHIGAVTIQRMVLLGSSLAVLYRDFEFNHSLRLYDEDLTLVKQYADFETSPSCLIPHAHGVLVLSATHVFFFASHACVLETPYDDRTVALDSTDNVVTKAMPKELGVESFQAFAVIDNERLLVVSTLGNTYLIYLKSHLSHKQITVTSFNFVGLGKSSIPVIDGLHHLTGNYFYISSKHSQSAIFQVLPSAPHVNIVQFVPNTTPIVDLHWHNRTVVSCQGGYDSGELVQTLFSGGLLHSVGNTDLRDMFRRVRVVLQETFLLSDAENNCLVTRETQRGSQKETDFSQTDIGKYPVYDCALLSSGIVLITNSGLVSAIDGSLIQTIEGVVDGRFKENHAFFVDTNNVLGVYADNHIQILQLAQKKLSSFDVVGSGKSTIDSGDVFVFLSWMDSTYTIVKYSNGFTLVTEGELPSKSVIFSSAVFCEDGNLYYVFLNLDCALIQMRFSLTAAFMGHVSTLPSKFPLRMNAYDATVWLHSPNEVFTLKKDPLFGYYRVCGVDAPCRDINDIAIWGEKLVILQNNMRLGIYDVHDSNTLLCQKKQYSHYIYTKCLPLGRKLVAIAQETQLNDIGAIAKLSHLDLCDLPLRKLLFNFASSQDDEFVDLCAFPHVDNLKGQSFVALSRVNERAQLKLFTVKKDKLNLVHSYDIDVECTLQSIAVVDSELLTFSLVGNVVLIAQYNWGQSGIVVNIFLPDDFKVPILCFSQAVVGEKLFLVDITGILEANVQGNEDWDVVLSKTPDEPQKFVTCIDASENFHGALVLSGDVYGNITLTLANGTIHSKFNIGHDQVNCVQLLDATGAKARDIALIGTLNGAIFKISYVSDEETSKMLEECVEELSDYSQQYNSESLLYKQKKLGTLEFERLPPAGIIDMRLIRKFVVAKKNGKERKKTYVYCNKEIETLTELCFLGSNL